MAVLICGSLDQFLPSLFIMKFLLTYEPSHQECHTAASAELQRSQWLKSKARLIAHLLRKHGINIWTL